MTGQSSGEHGPGAGTVTRPQDVTSRRAARLEVTVFLSLIVPSMVISYWVVRRGEIGFGLTAVSTIFRDAGLVALISLFLWKGGEPLSAIGLSAFKSIREIGLGALLFPPFFFGTLLLERALVGLGLSVPADKSPIALPGPSLGGVALGLALVLVVSISEEVIFRGYLTQRLRMSGLGEAGALLAANFLFALGHGYEGGVGVVTVGVMGVVFSLVYLWRQSLTASMTIHFLQDLLVVIVLPLLSGR